MPEAPTSDCEGFESDAVSTASEPPPDWNSDDEPPEDRIGDEHDCSRDGRVKKIIRRVGRGLDRPGQYDIVRMRWQPLPAAPGDADAGAADATAPPAPSGGGAAVFFGPQPKAPEPGELEVSMGEDRLPLAVEFALKTMRVGEIAEIRSPAAYAALASPLCGRRLRSRNGRLPRGSKVPRRRRFLPAAPRSLAAQAKLDAAQAKLDAMTGSSPGGADAGSEAQLRTFRAKVELLGVRIVHMLTEDRTVSKTVLSPGGGRRMPRFGDQVTFSIEPSEGGDEGAVRRTVRLGHDELPHLRLEHVLLSMKLGERCAATLPVEDSEVPTATETTQASRHTAWRYDPPEERKLELRTESRVDAPRAPVALLPGEAFEVAEELEGADGVLFLRLANGSGWAFDRLPGVGPLCVRGEPEGEPPALLRLVVTLHSLRRRDLVPVPLAGCIGFRPDADERVSWPALQKLELRPGPERLLHEIEEGSRVLVALAPAVNVGDAEGVGARLLCWTVGEGTVPSYMDAAVASMHMLEVSEFVAPSGKDVGVDTGPSYDGQTPARLLDLPELSEMLAALLNAPGDDAAAAEAMDEDSDRVEGRAALPAASLCSDWASSGAAVSWESVGITRTDEVAAAFRMALLAVQEAPDVCTMTEAEQQAFLERERAHGNALAKLGRWAEAAAAYTRALDAVRRTAVYKTLFPTERGHIQGAYSRDAAQGSAVFDALSPEDAQARRAGLVALHLNLALCASKQGKWAESRRHASTALGADPDSAKALFRRGSAALESGDLDEAALDLQRAAELQPQDRAIREALQMLQKRTKEHRAAQKSMFQNVFRPPARQEVKGSDLAPCELRDDAGEPLRPS